MEAADKDPQDVLDRVPLRFLVGPTASGKTALALEVAPRLGAEIVALDSMTIYRGLDLGTAKPTPEERARVPHHMIDVADPDEPFDLERYLRELRAVLAGMEERGVVPLFVGGTGLYLAAILRGLFQGPPSDPEVRTMLDARAQAEGTAVLHDELRGVDAVSAEKIHPNDRRRIVRALEVWLQTGATLSSLQEQWGSEPSARETRARIVGLQIPTAELDARIRERTAQMLRGGWPEEARRIAEGPGLGKSASQALGYGSALALACGEIRFEEALDTIALRTRQFARRQRTWFRKFDITWLDPSASDCVPTTTARLEAAQ